MTRNIAYWITTGILAFAIGSGGVAELAHLKPSLYSFPVLVNLVLAALVAA